jgi:hypothetical protein
MIRPPAASIRAAAAITSITMKGGTSPRAEESRRALAALSVASCMKISLNPAQFELVRISGR